MTRKTQEEAAAVAQKEDEVLFEVKRSETEVIRGTNREYKGKAYVDIRVFFKGGEGVYLPTKKGITLTRDIFREFAQAISNWADSV